LTPFFAYFAAFLSSILLLAACLTSAAFAFAFSLANLILSFKLLGFSLYYSTILRWAASTANGFSVSTGGASSFPSSVTAELVESGMVALCWSPVSSAPSS